MADQNTRNVNLIVKNEDERKEEVVISLAAIFRKLKKYLLAWFMVAVIVGGIVGGVSIFFSTTSSTPVRALVSFTHDGIEKGKNPDGSVFDPNSMKNPLVLERAISACNMDPQLLEVVRSDIEIEGIVPEDIYRYVEETGELPGTSAPSICETDLKRTYNGFTTEDQRRHNSL